MKESKRLFAMGFKPQQQWGGFTVASFFFGGVGAGLFFTAVVLGITTGMIVGLAIVALGKSAAHLLELGRPQRFWLVFFRPSTSWISRGIIFEMAFLVFGILYVAPLN